MPDLDDLIDAAAPKPWEYWRWCEKGDPRGDWMVLMVERGHTPHFPMCPSDFWGPF